MNDHEMTDAEWNALHGNAEDNAHLEPEEHNEGLTLEEATARVEAARKAALEPKWWKWEDEVQEERRK